MRKRRILKTSSWGPKHHLGWAPASRDARGSPPRRLADADLFCPYPVSPEIDEKLRTLSERALEHLAAAVKERWGVGLSWVFDASLSDEEALRSARVVLPEAREGGGIEESLGARFEIVHFENIPQLSLRILLVPFLLDSDSVEPDRIPHSTLILEESQLEEAKYHIQSALEFLAFGFQLGGHHAENKSADGAPEKTLEERSSTFRFEERLHEARTSIAAIQGFSELLLEELGSQAVRTELADQLEALSIIHDRSARLAELFTKSFSEAIGTHGDAMGGDLVDLSTLISRIIKSFHFSIEDRAIDFEYSRLIDQHDGPESIEVIAAPIETLLRNLLENALLAAPEGGKIALIVKRSKNRDGKDELELIVEDSGPGLSPEKRAELASQLQEHTDAIESFVEERVSERSGFGLRLIMRVLEARGGALEIGESESLGGASFRVRLPLPMR